MNAFTKLNNDGLVSQLKTIVATERNAIVNFLLCLKEIKKREVYLELGFRSLFDFCLSLGLSESCAYKRVTAVEILKRYPIVLSFLNEGSLHLTHLCVLSSVLTEENHMDLFLKSKGQSKRAVEEIVKILKDPIVVKPVCKIKMYTAPVVTTPAPTQSQPVQEESLFSAEPPAPQAAKPIVAELRLTCSNEFLDLLNRAKEITNSTNEKTEDLMIKVFKEFIERHAPEEKEKRAQKREEKKSIPAQEKKDLKPKSVRFIPAAVKRQVYINGKNQCSFVSQSGTRCQATRFLNIDHVQPVCLNGSSRPDNLRLLCRAHNAFKAKRDYGKEKIESYYKKINN